MATERRLRAFVPVLALLAVGGCAAFTSAPDASPANGGDASMPDVSVSPDAGAEAGVRWCRSHATSDAFCADFDDDAAAPEHGWSMKRAGADATVELVTTAASAPKSARMSLPQGSASCRYAELVYRSAVQATKGHLAFEIFLPGGVSTTIFRFGHASGCAIDITVHPTTAGVYVELDSSGKGGGYADFAAPIPQGQWTHVSVDFDFEALTFTASHGGAAPITKSVDPSCKKSDTVELNLGIHCLDGVAGAEAYFDNVLMTPR